jgi:hypothetical protein
MTTSDEKTIEINKRKFLLLILVSCAFVGLGLWVFALDSSMTFRTSPNRSPLVVTQFVGIFLIVTFGLLVAFGIKRILGKKTGMVFSSVGIAGGPAGLIPWGDVTGISVYEIHVGADKIYRHKMLVVKLANPEKYIGAGNVLERKLNRRNQSNFGSPIVFSCNEFKIDFSDLQRIADEYFLKYGKRGE